MRHYGNISAMKVDGVAEGTFWQADLFNYESEDGTTHEFRAGMLSEQEAKDLVAFWSTGGADMVRAAASCRMPEPLEQEPFIAPITAGEMAGDLGLSGEAELLALPVGVRRALADYYGIPWAEPQEIDTDGEREPFNHNLIR